MSIETGQSIPEATLQTMGPKGPEEISTREIFAGKKVVLFGVPGAFTPGCTMTHLPGYVVHADDIKAKGVDTIACMAVNDAFVMGAWGQSQNAEHLLMLADGNGDFSRALGLEVDASAWGMGMRCKRFAMIVDDGSVTHMAIEPPGGIVETAAEKILSLL